MKLLRAPAVAALAFALGTQAAAQTCFEIDPPLASGGDLPIRPELADFDADGDLDLGTYNAISYTLAVHRNQGDGTWSVPTLVPVAADTRDHAFFDVDGDGRDDLVYVGDLGWLTVRRSLGQSFANAAFYSVPGAVEAVAGGDLDADGDLDLVVAASGSFPGAGMARILRNDGSGSFVVEAGILANVHAVAIVDFDLDGDPDIAMTDYAPNQFRVAVNVGAGQFPGAPLVVGQPTVVASFTVADFDGDGRDDLITGLAGQGFALQFSTLDGFSGFVHHPTFPDGIASDVDADGDVDLVVVEGGAVRVLRNSGNGALALDGTIHAGPTSGGARGDVDGDGDEDLAFAVAWADQVLVLRNCAHNGTPTCFGDGSATLCPCGNASAVGARAGCLHSLGAAGTLRASGTTSIAADTLVLRGASMPNAAALYFQGTSAVNGGLGNAFGDGLSCAGGTIVRLGTATNVAGASQYPASGQPSVGVRGGVTSPGDRTYQAWYRNAASFCTPSTFNLTNSLRITWRL